MTESATPKVYLFGPFRLEIAERRLLRDGRPVPLTGKAFDTLQLLVEGAGTLQQQQSLMDRLWPNIFVEQNSLQYNISLVRRVLDDAPGVEIETVRRQGYRLIADVREASGPASDLPVVAAGQRVQFCRAGDGARLAYAFLGEGAAAGQSRALAEPFGARLARPAVDPLAGPVEPTPPSAPV